MAIAPSGRDEEVIMVRRTEEVAVVHPNNGNVIPYKRSAPSSFLLHGRENSRRLGLIVMTVYAYTMPSTTRIDTLGQDESRWGRRIPYMLSACSPRPSFSPFLFFAPFDGDRIPGLVGVIRGPLLRRASARSLDGYYSLLPRCQELE
jgi:hypothetical protein